MVGSVSIIDSICSIGDIKLIFDLFSKLFEMAGYRFWSYYSALTAFDIEFEGYYSIVLEMFDENVLGV